MREPEERCAAAGASTGILSRLVTSVLRNETYDMRLVRWRASHLWGKVISKTVLREKLHWFR